MTSPPPAPARHRGYLAGCFVVEHRPVVTGRATAVLLLPPFGYEDTCAFRPLRVLADRLAAEGATVLRLDWPGLGDSAGDDAEPDLVPRRIEAARAAVADLRRRGAARVVVVGLRAGALVALAAGDADALVLWAPPASGKALLREERAFHKMAARYFGEPPAEAVAPPPGAVEAGGFLYRAPTVAALEKLVAAELAAAWMERRRGQGAPALLLPRDGGEVPEALRAALPGATVGPEAGVGALLENPYESTVPAPVADALAAFCAGGPAGTVAPPRFDDRLSLPDGVVERPWVGRGEAGELSGVVCEPPGGAPAGVPWTIFYNAGGIRRSGPNRLWTTAARALAARGRPSLRFDVRDVGDSDGAAEPHHDLEEMYSERSVADALAAVDTVRAFGAGAVDAVGLCSGAFFGMRAAEARDVRRAVLFNGLVYVWDEEGKAGGMTAQITRSLLDGRRWRRLLTGRIDARALARAVLTEGRLRAARLAARARGAAPPDPVGEIVARVASRGTDLHFVCSAGDPSIEYLDRHLPPGLTARRTVLPGVDHTIRPVWAHPRVVELLLADL